MDSSTPTPKSPRVHLLKADPTDLQRYVMESSTMHVILPGVSGLVSSDWDNENNGDPLTSLRISVHIDVFNALPYPVVDEYGLSSKQIDFGNGVTINVTVNPFAGMSDDEAQALAEDMCAEEERKNPLTEEELKSLDEFLSEPVADPIRL